MGYDAGKPPAVELDPLHEEWLRKESAISVEVIKKSGVYTITDAKDASKLLGRGAKYWPAHLPVLIFPYRLPFLTDPVRFRGKPTKAFETPKSDGSVSLAKYVEAKGSPVHIYFGPSLLNGRARTDVEVPLLVTEGERKCLSAESHGFSCIAVSGVSQWHQRGQESLHSDFSHVMLDGREVFLVFDADALTNKDVRREELALGRKLLAAGAKVYVVRLPAEAPKLDDFLACREVTEFAALIEDARQHGKVVDQTQPQGVPAPATEMTDLANAERFAKQHGDELRFCEQTQTWYVWTGLRWEIDSTGAVVRRAMKTVRKIYEEADSLKAEDARNAMRVHARKSEAQARINAIVKLAGALKRIAVKLDAFDADPWLLNVENGTVDLRTGELRDHDRGDLITKVAPVHYDIDAKHDKWARFLDGISNGNAEIVDFLARAVGYSLTGDTREDKYFVLYGPAKRGKSTFVGIVEAVLGDYARTADPSTFMASPMSVGGDKPRPDLVRLMGARIVVSKEIEIGAKMNEALVKTITGGDVIAVRDLHSRHLEMRPTYKLWFVVNDCPVVRGDDTGMWRRILRVPFDKKVENPEEGFREAMIQEPELRSAVLAWAVSGVRMWREGGLNVPKAIADSTAEYRAEMDHTSEFFSRKCLFDSEARVSRKALRKAYTEWCEEHGYSPLGARRFASNLRDHVRDNNFNPADADTTVREEHRVLDGWKFVRLLTDSELASCERWGGRYVVHSGHQQDEERREKGDVGRSEVFSAYDKNPSQASINAPNHINSPYIPTEKEKGKESKELVRSDNVGSSEKDPTISQAEKGWRKWEP